MAGERVKRYELESGGQPDHVLFQSWEDKPDRVLPESEPFTWTGFIKTYFEDRSVLGFRREGAGANLAYRKTVRVSSSVPGHGGELAVDREPGASWSAGDFAPQWIEIDLDAAHNIREIRLLPDQYPAGKTVHRVLGKGWGTGHIWRLLYTLEGTTKDSQVLSYTPPQRLTGIQVIRIETVSSPSWVAWREIGIIDAGQ
jgi:hypothetical protein